MALAGFGAGWLEAVVGGGLVQLPALLLGSPAPAPRRRPHGSGQGSRFVRVVFVFVLATFIIRIGGSAFGPWS